MIRWVIYVSVVIIGVGGQAGAQGIDELVAVDSAELEADIQAVRYYDELLARQDSLRARLDTLPAWIDTLQIRANKLALRHNYVVNKIDNAREQLTDRHFELEDISKYYERQDRWLTDYYRRVNFVRYKTFWVKPEDRRANRIFKIGNALMLVRIGLEVTGRWPIRIN